MARTLLFSPAMRNYLTTRSRFACDVRFGALLGAAVLALGACSSDETIVVTDEDYDQVAQSLGAATAARGDVAALSVANDLALGELPLGLVLDSAGRFEGRLFGLSYEIEIECRDANDVVMLACSESSDSATVSTTWSGTLNLPRLEASALRTGTWELHGLQDDLVTVDGAAHFDLVSVFSSASNQNTKTLALRYDASYEGVVADTATSTFVDGEVRFAIDGERTHTTPGMAEERAFSLDAVISFADGTYTLVLDGDRTYAIDARTGAVVRVDLAN